jgi:hypothetical protein
MISSKLDKKNIKLDLKRYASNRTLAKTQGNKKSGFNNFTETTSQVSSTVILLKH